MLAQTAPYFGIAAIYFVIRGSILGEVQIPEGSAYKMSFDPSAILWRAWVFIGNIWNLSFETPGATGEGSYATWLASRLGFSKRWITGTELIFLASASALLAISVLRGARKNLWLLVPLLWIFLFIGPTFLIRNIQVYYILEPMAGAAMLLAIAVDSWKPPGPVLWRAWGIVLALAGLNTLVHSQHIHIYSWRFCADAAETVFKEIKADRGIPAAKSDRGRAGCGTGRLLVLHDHGRWERASVSARLG